MKVSTVLALVFNVDKCPVGNMEEKAAEIFGINEIKLKLG